MKLSSVIILTSLISILSFTFTSAETFGYGRTEQIPINYSLIPTVNNSQFLQGLTPQQVANLFDASGLVPYSVATNHVNLGTKQISASQVNTSKFLIGNFVTFSDVGGADWTSNLDFISGAWRYLTNGAGSLIQQQKETGDISFWQTGSGVAGNPATLSQVGRMYGSSGLFEWSGAIQTSRLNFASDRINIATSGATGTQAIAIGINSVSTGDSGIAIGGQSASINQGVAIGFLADARNGSIAIGTNAKATNPNEIVFSTGIFPTTTNQLKIASSLANFFGNSITTTGSGTFTSGLQTDGVVYSGGLSAYSTYDFGSAYSAFGSPIGGEYIGGFITSNYDDGETARESSVIIANSQIGLGIDVMGGATALDDGAITTSGFGDMNLDGVLTTGSLATNRIATTGGNINVTGTMIYYGNTSANLAEWYDASGNSRVRIRALDGRIIANSILLTQIEDNINARWALNTNNVRLSNISPIVWSSTGAFSGTQDVGLIRDSAGTLKITNSSTGLGNLVVGNITANGNQGVSVSGTNCTITNISGGIITGATCT